MRRAKATLQVTMSVSWSVRPHSAHTAQTFDKYQIFRFRLANEVREPRGAGRSGQREIWEGAHFDI